MMKNMFLKTFIILIAILPLIGTVALGQSSNNSTNIDWYAQLDNPQNPGNYFEKASQGEATAKLSASHNHAVKIFQALKSNNRSGIEQFIPTFDDAVTFMTVTHFSNEKVRKGILQNFEAWHSNLKDRINTSLDNVIRDAKQKGFDWNTAEIYKIDNKFKKQSQFAGGEVKIYAKDANDNTYVIRMSSLFEVEGKWMMINQFIIK